MGLNHSRLGTLAHAREVVDCVLIGATDSANLMHRRPARTLAQTELTRNVQSGNGSIRVDS